MSAVSRLSLHRLESLQQLFVKLQHNQRIVSEQAEARRSDVFTAALSHLTGKRKSHGRCFARDLEIAGAWRGQGRPRLSLGVAGCQKIAACSEGGDARARPHLSSGAIARKPGKTRGGRDGAALSPVVLAAG